MKKFFIIMLFCLCLFNIDNVFAADKCEIHSDKDNCVNNKCAWNDEYNFCSPNGLAYIGCGDAKDIPAIAPKLTNYAVTALKTATPIILIVVAIVDLVKAITAGKEDEIKKAQGSLLKKAITAALVFFVITIVQFVMLRVADDSEHDSLSSCLSCFLNGPSDSKCESIYYKDGYGNCKYLSGDGDFVCEE